MKDSQPTREKILDAVFKLVYIHGYNGTSMTMILKECGIPKGSLYHYFKSKKEMVLVVVQERINPRMNEFYQLDEENIEDGIEALIVAVLKVSKNEMLVSFGCPLNRLNQEMSPVDADFDEAIGKIYKRLCTKIKKLLQNSQLKEDVDITSLAEFIIATVWGSLSLSPSNSSTSRYLATIQHLVTYLKSLKV